jgi:hypothetical protein
MEIENGIRLTFARRTLVVAGHCRHGREGVGAPGGRKRKAGGLVPASMGIRNSGEFDVCGQTRARKLHLGIRMEAHNVLR